jgi:hypothetical protein
MARTQTMVQLTDELVAVLDAEATRRDLSRSALIREAVEHHLDGARRAGVGECIIAGYRRIPVTKPDGWAGLDALAEAATGEVAQRLDAEERQAGFDPW